jgi:hypothetical protein
MGPEDRERGSDVVFGIRTATLILFLEDFSGDPVHQPGRRSAAVLFSQLDSFVHRCVVRNPIKEEALVKSQAENASQIGVHAEERAVEGPVEMPVNPSSPSECSINQLIEQGPIGGR